MTFFGSLRLVAVAGAVVSVGCSSGAASPAVADAHPCPSVASYCNAAGKVCLMDWLEAQQPSGWCVRVPDGGLLDDRVYIRTNCYQMNVVWQSQFDGTKIYFYDPGSGQLTGISDALTQTCLAGVIPSSFVSAVCGEGPTSSACDPKDGGP
jgi:hypothetical protein